MQILKVKSDAWDGGGYEPEYQVHYVLYEGVDEDGNVCFDLYRDDGKGNGNMVFRAYHRSSVLEVVLRLGEFVEWGEGQKPERTAA